MLRKNQNSRNISQKKKKESKNSYYSKIRAYNNLQQRIRISLNWEEITVQLHFAPQDRTTLHRPGSNFTNKRTFSERNEMGLIPIELSPFFCCTYCKSLRRIIRCRLIFFAFFCVFIIFYYCKMDIDFCSHDKNNVSHTWLIYLTPLSILEFKITHSANVLGFLIHKQHYRWLLKCNLTIRVGTRPTSCRRREVNYMGGEFTLIWVFQSVPLIRQVSCPYVTLLAHPNDIRGASRIQSLSNCEWPYNSCIKTSSFNIRQFGNLEDQLLATPAIWCLKISTTAWNISNRLFWKQ